MAEHPSLPEVIETERRILRLLCQGSGGREALADFLRHYRWRDLAHRVIFEIVSGGLQVTEERMRALLPARLTNAGFPDFPWEDLFRPCDDSKKDVEFLIQRLQTFRD